MSIHHPASLFQITVGDSPIVATAVHDGHDLRPAVSALMSLTDAERLREEDPFTARWTEVASSRVIACRSRFETDLNRPRDKAIYLSPEDAWGLHVWKEPPPRPLIQQLLADYDSFYELVHTALSQLVRRHGKVIVLDLHTFNHRRSGPNSDPADPLQYPEVNVGTGTLDRARWSPIVDRFLTDLRQFDFLGRHLDVRENICFRGGNLSRWIHENFPTSVCSLAIEFKKFFMNEWTGEPDERQLLAIRAALASTLPGLVDELRGLAK